jgi:putative phosphoribosyl transferase
MSVMPFVDRVDAGRRLAAALSHLRGTGVVVLGLPRGGVPVASEVAAALDAPLDVIVVRKLGVPFQAELAMGAIGEGVVRVLNHDLIRMAGVTGHELAQVEERERAELERRAERFRAGRPRVDVRGRTVVIVDDGVATGSTAKTACRVAKALGAARVIVAVPVASRRAIAQLRDDAEVVCLESPEDLWSVGEWYRNFTQTTDDEVVALLDRAAPRALVPAVHDRPDDDPGGDDPPIEDSDIEVRADGARLSGHLTVPESALGLVMFAHGSGSSRHSPRNRFVAELLRCGRFGTLLFDLLAPSEEADRANVFDIELLGGRLLTVTAWARAHPSTAALTIGYFGASTGAAAALWAAAEPAATVSAIVSRGGRPDLAAGRLALVHAPTLLIVGSRDAAVLELNRKAKAAMRCEARLAVVPGASHLFEEPGTLAAAAELACGWFACHLLTRQPCCADSRIG